MTGRTAMMLAAGLGTRMLKGLMKKKGVMSLEDLMKTAAEFGVEIIVCEMSMDLMGIKREELIEGVEENMISLSNGCVCCEIRDDLVTSLEQLLVREEQIDYVILEASGVSDPEGIVMTFLDRKFAGLLRLDSITWH